MIVEKAYAKINLALEVKEKRLDGYHEVTNLMVPVDLYDELTFELIESGIELESDINIEDNFVYKAAKLFFETYNITKGVKITLKKNIPLQAGLAGGSSDAAACLRGLNRLFETNRSLDELANLSAKLGSDMPFCVYQKLALCTGRGEIVKTLNFHFNEIDCTLIKPNFGFSTKDIFSNYKYEPIDRIQNFDNILKGICCGNNNLIEDNIFNDLQKVSFNISKELKTLYDLLSGSNKVFMSGSGPTLFIFSHNIPNIDKIDKNYKVIYTKVKNFH